MCKIFTQINNCQPVLELSCFFSAPELCYNPEKLVHGEQCIAGCVLIPIDPLLLDIRYGYCNVTF